MASPGPSGSPSSAGWRWSAGFSLATGMTVGRLATGTKRAAGTVRDTAERGRTAGQEPGRERAGSGERRASSPGSPRRVGTAPSSRSTRSTASAAGSGGSGGRRVRAAASGCRARGGDQPLRAGVRGLVGRAAGRAQPAGSRGNRLARARRILDGAEAFADLYGASAMDRPAGAAAGGAVQRRGSGRPQPCCMSAVAATVGVAGVVGARSGEHRGHRCEPTLRRRSP